MKNIKIKSSHKMNALHRGVSSDRSVIALLEEAQSYYEQNKLEQSNYLFQQVLKIDPENIIAFNTLGLIAMKTGMLTLALELFNIASEINPQHLVVNKNIALVYTRMSCFDEAILQYINILDIDENNSDAHGELARLNLQAGNTEIALSHFKRAFELNPEDPRNLHGVAQLDANYLSDEALNKIDALLSKQNMSIEKRSSYYFALGTVYDHRGLFDEAFANYSVANMCKLTSFDQNTHRDFIDNTMHTFSKQYFTEIESSAQLTSEQPVFIVGMPRSGTTLVEQILASHRDVYATGEIAAIDEIASQFALSSMPDQVRQWSMNKHSSVNLRHSAQHYINTVNALALEGGYKRPLRITNKSTVNYMNLGFIATLFPNAKIIHCVRNPLDVCLSCYFQNFSGGHAYSNNLETLGRYYQQYERLMTHWMEALPIDIHTVDYADMVNNTEATSRDLVEFTGLDWQQQCNEFYHAKSRVSTASLAQVRKRIYHSSLDRWKNYEGHLSSLKNALLSIDAGNDKTQINGAQEAARKINSEENVYIYQQ